MDYFIHIAIICSLYVSLAVSLNLLVGYTGILSVSHAAFYGIGAYATAINTAGARTTANPILTKNPVTTKFTICEKPLS